MGILANENSISAGGYTIERSLRFQSASSQYASRTPSASSRTKWTWSGWVKLGALGNGNVFIGATSSTANWFYVGTNTSNQLRFVDVQSSSVIIDATSTAVYRDPSAWYHVVFSLDTTQSVASDRLKAFVNGIQISLSANPAQNSTPLLNSNIAHYIGVLPSVTGYMDGYLAEVNFIDGQALTPSSFGETDALTGVWVAKKYTGTYGTNGFYLKFNDGTSTTTLGQDRSGNANNWTLTNFTRSAGVSDCWMLDVPSGNGSPSATQPSSNYAVMNPLKNGGLAFSRANLRVVQASAAWVNARASIQVPSSGKYYLEFISSQNYSVNNVSFVGLCTPSYSLTGASPDIGSMVNSTTSGEVMALAIDADAKILYYYRNNTNIGNTSFSSFTEIDIVVGAYQASGDLNFGQRSFAYTPPSGYKALCTANLPAPTIAKGNQYMDATLYTGNSASRSITNAAGFSPDMVWVKARSAATDNYIWDTVRGANGIVTNSTAAEFAGAQVVPTSNGFDLAASTGVNNNTVTYVAWQWDAGSSTVTNTSGTISSQVRANTTAGFSIVTFTSTGSAGAVTVGHGLGVAPAMVITKERGAVGSWGVYHKGLATPASQYLNLQTTSAATTNTSYWGNTNPSSTVVTLGNGTMMALNTTMVMYCFAEIAGFSRFGSYTGNGSTDGTFNYTGFRPKFVMIKCSSAVASWVIFDSVRLGYNATEAYLVPNSSGAEGTVAGFGIDILSNGFKIRTTDGTMNTNGGTYIYAAFAENPFNYSNAR